MDQAVQEVQLPMMENLINIPIEMPERSGILNERDSSEKMNQGMKRQELGKQIRQKQRRIKRKENSKIENGKNQISEINMVEKKRQWTFQDENDEQK